MGPMTLIKNLYLNPRLFLILGIWVMVFITAFLYPAFMRVAQLGLLVTVLLLLLDLVMLFRPQSAFSAQRHTPDRFSNGDENPITLALRNEYPFPVQLTLIDEIPFQFQLRDFLYRLSLKEGEQKNIEYKLRPVERGEYTFGCLNVYVAGPLGLIRRRYRFAERPLIVPTYPSYLQMRKYQLMAISNRLQEVGVKKIRRLGHTSEFEQIKEYVRGDDYRTVNWKATARAGRLMVNQFTDERAQNVICLIDKSRNMKMPFEGMTLLDYAINASLVISNIAIHKHDKAGLITFAERINSMLPTSNKPIQMSRIQEVLYNQQTRFLEADYGRLYAHLKQKVSQRSLLILFTNFESIGNLRRQLPYLQKIARSHLLMVIFFENTELTELLRTEPNDLKGVYTKTIGENFAFEKKLIARELEHHGIISILTPPEHLTVNTLNKYLELKSRGMI